MGQHEIPQPLRMAQARAMPDHDPGMGPQHGDMVVRGLGVDGPTPILTTVTPALPSRLEVILGICGTSLGTAQRRVRDR